MAISRVGVRQRIASITEASEEARLCSLNWDLVVAKTLCQYPWGFAGRRSALAIIEENPNVEWLFRYAMPVDCESPRYIQGAGRNLPNELRVRWQVEGDGTAERSSILTDEAEAVLVYTTNAVATNLYPAHFVDLLVWNLACELAMPLVAKVEVAGLCINAARTALLYARTAQLNEGQEDMPLESEFVRARD